MAVICHRDSWLELQHLGKGQPYHPTYSDTLSIGPTHRRLLQAPLKPGSVCIDVGIPGSLRREDAAKLYELAFFGTGDILTLGLDHGLSAAIIAQAVSDSSRNCLIIGVDAEIRPIKRSQTNLSSFNFDEITQLIHMNPLAYCDVALSESRKFGFAFVDHSTDYESIVALCGRLPELISKSGFVLFHDFNDRRNKEPRVEGYGVFSGVVDGLLNRSFTFYGIFGCSGLFRKV